jgi:hypothetical protein
VISSFARTPTLMIVFHFFFFFETGPGGRSP